MAIRIEGLKGVLDALRALPLEVVSKNGGIIKSSMRKSLLPMVAEAKLNVQRIIDAPNKDERESNSSGLLKESIGVWRGKKIRGEKGERMVVGVRPGRAARFANNKSNVRKGRAGATYEKNSRAFWGYFLEYGTNKMNAKPWLRPAFDATKNKVLDIFDKEINKKITRIIKKLESAK